MNERKTLGYDWKFGHEELVLAVDAYFNDSSLYIGFYQKKEESLRYFGDLTVSLSGSSVEVNEAYISDFNSRANLEFIERHKLGKVLPDEGYSGFCRYAKVAFDLERLAEFDEEGIKQYKEVNGIKK